MKIGTGGRAHLALVGVRALLEAQRRRDDAFRGIVAPNRREERRVDGRERRRRQTRALERRRRRREREARHVVGNVAHRDLRLPERERGHRKPEAEKFLLL